LWEQLGKLQLDTCVREGLKPSHKFLDIGCGSLRGGVNFIKYLNSGNYFGLDINESLIAAGYDKELDDVARRRTPRSNLKQNENFDFSLFNKEFDFALALSVFTHLSLNDIRVCMERLSLVMKSGAKFLASFFQIESDRDSFLPMQQEMGIVTQAAADPFHYYEEDFFWIVNKKNWLVETVFDFNHPRNQKLLRFTRL
jgi:ubiquinone/menaquinone biosynthesis C-methylase UbiE